MNELEKTLGRMGIKIAIKPVLSLPVGTPLHRVALTRKVRKDGETTEVRLTMLISAFAEDLTAQTILTLIIRDTLRGDASFWDYKTSLGGEQEDSEVEILHKACKSVGKRARRFFGDKWDTILQVIEGSPTVAKTEQRKSTRPPAVA